MVVIKKLLVLSGDISGIVKLEKIGENASGSMNIMGISGKLSLIIKLGDGDAEMFEVNDGKCVFRLKYGSCMDGNISAALYDKSNNRMRCAGANYKGCNAQCLVKEINLIESRRTVIEDKALLEEKVAMPITEANVVPESELKPCEQSEKVVEEVATPEVSATIVRSGAEEGCTLETVMMATEARGEELFYDRVSDRLGELFASCEHDVELENLVHSSRWVRVDYDDSNYYVVGVIDEDESPLFICYGVPVESKKNREAEVNSGCEWLPLDRNDINGRGYWVLYQDARTGETLS